MVTELASLWQEQSGYDKKSFMGYIKVIAGARDSLHG